MSTELRIGTPCVPSFRPSSARQERGALGAIGECEPAPNPLSPQPYPSAPSSLVAFATHFSCDIWPDT